MFCIKERPQNNNKSLAKLDHVKLAHKIPQTAATVATSWLIDGNLVWVYYGSIEWRVANTSNLKKTVINEFSRSTTIFCKCLMKKKKQIKTTEKEIKFIIVGYYNLPLLVDGGRSIKVLTAALLVWFAKYNMVCSIRPPVELDTYIIIFSV